MITNELYRIAKRQLDVQEIAGGSASKEILEYLSSTTVNSQLASTDETPWCSAFVNWVVERAGLTGTDSAAAVSWLKWGVTVDKPQKGTIVIFQWSNGGHHVGFVNKLHPDGKISVLGGNQSNRVRVSDFNSSSVIGYRNPKRNFFSRPVKIAIGLLAVLTSVFTYLAISGKEK